MTTITAREFRQGIRNLLVEYLGLPWARANILAPYGGLNLIPRAALPPLYAKAQADALEVVASARRSLKRQGPRLRTRQLSSR